MEKRALLIQIILFLAIQFSFCQNPQDKTESPYFFITSEKSSADHFPLISTDVKVQIRGPVADVVVRQQYKNDGEVAIEALYVFPGSTRAAVYDLEFRVGDRIVRAEIREKQKARAEYEQAKKEGKRATLLEQHRPNVFQMNVANILPGDEVEVILRYNEFLLPEEGEYTFVYPTVVGPRFNDPSQSNLAGTSFVSQPYTKAGEKQSYFFNILLDINCGIPITKSWSPSHKVDIQEYSKEHLSALHAPYEGSGGNKDFIFKFKLRGNGVQAGTLLYEHGDESFFLTMIEPPANFEEAEILPREFIFVLDVSGSMNGFPLSISKAMMNALLSSLQPTDKFNILFFSGGSNTLSPTPIAATKENIESALEFVHAQRGGGSTQILNALKATYALPRSREELSRSVVILTDGYISVEQEAFEIVRDNLHRCNIFAFGIGSSVNRHLIEGLAHVGRGEATIITKPEEAKSASEKFVKYVRSPLLSNLSVRFDNFDAYDILPKRLPDLMAERPIWIFGKYRGKAQGDIVLTGTHASGQFQKVINLTKDNSDKKNVALRTLWAREKIRERNDFTQYRSTQEDIAEITELGLKYNLLTKYTSFLAVLEEQVNNGEDLVTVNQVLPMPEGVSNYAVGFKAGFSGIGRANNNNHSKDINTISLKISFEDFSSTECEVAIKNKLENIFNTLGEEDKKRLHATNLILKYNPVEKVYQIEDKCGLLSKDFICKLELKLNAQLSSLLINVSLTIEIS